MCWMRIKRNRNVFKARLNEVHCKEESSSSKGRHAKMHVSHSLTSCSEGSPEDHEKQSGDDDDLVHPQQAHERVLQGTAVLNHADTCAQFEDDALCSLLRQTPIKLVKCQV